MGRSSWRAESCRTCITRKVKCDKNQPECFRCKSSCRTCGGYNQLNGTILRKDTPWQENQSSLAMFQSKKQLISRFLEDYLPPKTRLSVAYQSSISWVENFPDFLDSQSIIMETSLSTLTLMHMARSQKDSALAGYSKYYYNLLMKQILGLRELKGPTDLIRAGMILALYETYNPMPDQENAWPVHVKAVCDLMKESHNQRRNLLNEHDIRRLYTMEFLRLCNTGFLAAIPSPYLRNGSSDVFDQLLEIIFQATILFHGYQRSRQNESLNLTAAEHMLTAASNYETMLLTWYGQLQCQSDQPLFMAQDHPRQPQAIIAFPNMSTIPLLLVYWLGMVVVYDSMLEALETLQVAHQSSPDEYGDFERKMKETDAIFRLYFAHITQCQAGVDTGNGLGASIMASATLSAAYQVYLRREMRKSYDNMHSSLHK